MKCAGIIAKHVDPRAEKIVSELGGWLESRGKRVVLDKETAALMHQGDAVTRSKLPEACDFLIVIGGDGTLLSAARVVGTSGKPTPTLRYQSFTICTYLVHAWPSPRIQWVDFVAAPRQSRAHHP